MKIGIDIDNVISNFNDTIVEAYLQHDKKLRNTGIINDKAKVFRRGMFDWSEEEEKDFYYSNIEKWANAFKPINNAEYYIKKLKQDGNEIYIIPSLNIKEVFRSGSYEIVKNPNGEEHSIVRGNCYKIHRLADILGIESKDKNEGIMILVESEIGNICIIVDKIIGQQNVVIKPIPQLLTQFEKVQSYMSGCSILEDGSISLIFDVNSIITR